MSDKKISEVSKKGQDGAMAMRLWNLSIGLLREKVRTLGYGLVVGSMLPHDAIVVVIS
jgi:hypothetical protein